MKKYGTYAGKILRVNLSNGLITHEALSEELIKDYIGGNGFGTKFLFDEVPAKADPLGVLNKIFLFVGPAQGTSLPAIGSRAALFTKSPLNNRYLGTYFGGNFGSKLKYAGYDGIIIEGKSSKPVYVYIDNDNVEIKDAGHIWGLNTFEAQLKIQELLNEQDVSTVTIGKAGENQVKVSCTIAGVHAAGRGGSGAVFGSKNLKAITVKGSKDVTADNIEEIEKYSNELLERMKANPGTGKALPTYGTAAVVTVNNQLGMLGSYNWQEEVFEGAGNITGTYLRENNFIKSDACYGCPIACAKVNIVREGKYEGAMNVGPEYETLFSLGSNCGIDNVGAIIKGDRLCDELGLDTISSGAVISMAMECYEKGLLTLEDTDGIDLKFGNDEAMLSLLEDIAEKRGLGALLGQGTKRMGEIIGKGAEDYAIHVKGMEVPAHSARGVPGMAIGYATSNRGGTHQDGRPTAERAGAVDINKIEGKGYYTVDIQRMTTLSDCIIHCRMTEGILGLTAISEDHRKLLNLVTGITRNIDELIDVADRIYSLQRAFNIREGESRVDDALPKRFTTQPIPSGPAAGKYMSQENLDKLLDETYEKRGWDKKTGYPTKETLVRLGLEYVIEEIYK